MGAIRSYVSFAFSLGQKKCTKSPPEGRDIVSGQPAVDEHDGRAEGEEALERLLKHILQQHHTVLLLLPHLTVGGDSDSNKDFC